MSWGAMMGLGQGLQGVGQMILDHNKDKMRERLEREREERKHQLELEREARQQAQFKESRPELRDGAWYMVDYNQAGREMDRRLAPQNVIQQMEREASLHDLTVREKEANIESRSLDALLKGHQLENAGTMAALDQALQEARINTERSRAARYNRMYTGSDGTSAASVKPDSQLAIEMIDLNKDLVESLTTGENPALSLHEVNGLAQAAIRAARDKGKDPIDVFQRTLDLYQKRRAAGIGD